MILRRLSTLLCSLGLLTCAAAAVAQTEPATASNSPAETTPAAAPEPAKAAATPSAQAPSAAPADSPAEAVPAEATPAAAAPHAAAPEASGARDGLPRMTVSPASACPSIPDSLGRAGMAAEGTNLGIMIAGGANFPDAEPGATTPEQRGAKRFYSDITLLSRPDAETGAVSTLSTGQLPYPVAYAATARISMGMIIAGGCNDKQHLSRVIRVECGEENGQRTWEVSDLPELPLPLAYAAFVEQGGKLYIFGGQESPDATTASNRCFVLNTALPKEGWKELPPLPGAGRILATAGCSGGKIYVTGGCALKAGSNGTAERRYLSETLCFDPAEEAWSRVADAPASLAGAACPMPSGFGELYLIGGDPGDYYRASLAGQAPAQHPGQSRRIYAYRPAEGTWTLCGELVQGIATAPSVTLGEGAPVDLLVISGETAPGVRTPRISRLQVHRDDIEHLESAIALTPWLAIGLGIVALLLALRKGLRSKPMPPFVPTQSPGKWAWIAVAVLWVVVMLNYFDRQLIAVFNTSITRGENGIAMTQAQFGTVTSAFLIVYAALSPIGGYLSDRFSRKFIIMCSLVIWSVVTWLTGKAETYEELLIARAAMGISEAFYIPAALSLISDYHRGGTRSMATGLHMSGIYAGQMLAGYGALMAGEPCMLGWRLTFEAFGFIGVAYALIVIIFLHDPDAVAAPAASATDTADNTTAAQPAESASTDGPAAPPPDEATPSADNAAESKASDFSMLSVLRSLFTGRAMAMLLIMYAFAGFANWFLMNWYPRLLQDMFGLSEAQAAPTATFWINIAKFAAVLGAAVIADRWYLRNRNARAYVPGICFCIAGPCVILAMAPSLGIALPIGLAVTVALVSTQGIAQGALDATLMPVLRSHIDERFSATGYGMLNLTSVGAGALVSWLGGQLMDSNIALSVPLTIAGVMMVFCGLLFFLLPKQRN